MKNFARILALLAILPANAWTQNPGGFKVKNRSSFVSVESLRNPFWPIGFTPGAVVSNDTKPAALAPQKPAVTAEDFNLTSISSFKGARMAMLSGKAVGEGELVTINLGGQRTKVQIVTVADGAVVLRCMGLEITVPLKRPELDLISKPVQQEPTLHSQEDNN